MRKPPWTYLFLFDDEVGSWERVKSFIDSRWEIINWHSYFANAFLIVSSLDASHLSDVITKNLTKKKGRFLILDTDTDRNGWLPRSAWNLMGEPKSALDERKKKEAGGLGDS
jgi:hypothetical protein